MRIGLGRALVARLRRLDPPVKPVRRRDEFIALLSHELRNPLAAIRNAGTLVARTAEGVCARSVDVIDDVPRVGANGTVARRSGRAPNPTRCPVSSC